MRYYPGKELHGQERRSCRRYKVETKDRTIVTFGGEPDAAESPAAAGFDRASGSVSMDVDIPQEVTPSGRPFEISSAAGQSAPAAQNAAGSGSGGFLEGYRDYDRRPEAVRPGTASPGASAPQDSEYLKARAEAEKFESRYGKAAPAAGSAGTSGSAGTGYRPPASSAYKHAQQPVQPSRKKKREPKYVTRGALIACMVLTMILSSLFGAFIGGSMNRVSAPGSSDGGTVQDSSDNSSLSISDATGSELTISQIVSMNADSVVEILVSGSVQNYFGQMQPVEGAGSGVIVREDGYIVTNYHVIQGANKVQVTLHNGETYPATIIGGDNDNDIAIIKINATGLTTAKIGDSSKVAVGDTAVAIGNPLGQLGGTATTGIISALDRNLEIEGRTLNLIQTDAAINGGNSGGGLFNSKGELIGIVDAKSSGVGIEGLAFAIPINSVTGIITDIIENGNVTTRPVVGITIAEVSKDSAQYYQLDEPGVYITAITGENAKKAGLQEGDRILSIDGVDIESSQQFITAVKKHKVGDTVTIIVSRGGQEIEIKTVLEEYTEPIG